MMQNPKQLNEKLDLLNKLVMPNGEQLSGDSEVCAEGTQRILGFLEIGGP
jgi:hypothetical protein